MDVYLSLDYRSPEDYFLQGLVSRSGLPSPDAYVEALVRAHLQSHADVRRCPNEACGLPAWPHPEYPPARRRDCNKPTWVLPRHCIHCGAALEG